MSIFSNNLSYKLQVFFNGNIITKLFISDSSFGLCSDNKFFTYEYRHEEFNICAIKRNSEKYYTFNVCGAFVASLLRLVKNEKEIFFPLEIDLFFKDALLKSLIVSMHQELIEQGGGKKNLYVKEILNFSIMHFRKNKRHIINSSHEEKKEKIDPVIKYIEDNLNKNFCVDQMAAYVSMSVFHFIREFKKRTGKTPRQYVINLRINHATSLLAFPEKSISEIGFECGYEDVSNFSYAFKRTKGCSPSQYRDNYKKVPALT